MRLTFKPTIAGDVIRLKVQPEVSSLDFNNGITLAGLPHSGADDAARRDRRRAARRPVVRDRRPAEQRHAGRQGGDPDPEQAADHRRAVQEQVGARRAHRADGADHAAPGAAARSRRSAAAADAAEVVPAGADRRGGRRRPRDPAPTPARRAGPSRARTEERHAPQPCRRAAPARARRGAVRRGATGARRARRGAGARGRGDDGAARLLGADDRSRARCGWRERQAQNAADAGGLGRRRVARLRRPGRHLDARQAAARRIARQHRSGATGRDRCRRPSDQRVPVPGRRAPASPANACRCGRRRGGVVRHAAAGRSSRACSAISAAEVRASASAQGPARQRDAVPAAVRRSRSLDRDVPTPRTGPTTTSTLRTPIRYDAAADADTTWRPIGTPGTGITVAAHDSASASGMSDTSLSTPIRSGRRLPVARSAPAGRTATSRTRATSRTFTSCSGQPRVDRASRTVVYVAHRARGTPTIAVDALMAPDPGASWDASRSIRGSAFAVSPRLITIAVLDPSVYARRRARAATCVPPSEPHRASSSDSPRTAPSEGVIVPAAGSFDQAAPHGDRVESTFLRTVALVR